MGDDISDWSNTLCLINRFFKNKGCCVVTAMASHPKYIKSLISAGYVLLRRSPFWLRDRNGNFDNAEWHLTFAEGDLGYRNIYPNDFKKPD